MNYGEAIVYQIDAQVVREDDEDGLRTHLGGSVLGEKCMRRVWFGWKWADKEEFDGRMLRLFERGHKSEAIFADLLRGLGAQVWTEDPTTGKQIRISVFGGHSGGALDGAARGLPNLPPELPPDTIVMLEMKTHNDKSWNDLVKKGLIESKPKHYKQSQYYMHHFGLRWCLYMAVNKNTDKLWCWLFPYDPNVGTHLTFRAETIIFGTGRPPRISESPSWYECTYCPMKGVCHEYKMPKVSCRTCVHSAAQRDGTWACARGFPEITTAPKVGCPNHLFDPDLFAKSIPMSFTPGPDGQKVSITYRTQKGQELTNGVGGLPSDQFDLTC